MSIFTRPDSPPPRQPSPELAYAPLPLRARQRTMSSQNSASTYAPSTPPGLGVRRSHKPILSVRSYDHLHEKASLRSGQHHHDPRSRNTPARSNQTASPPTTPRSLPLPSPSRSQFSDIPPRRTLSNAIPYRSPPPSPTIAAPPPPVPPIPAFILSPPAQIKPTDCPQPATIMPIHLPHLDILPSLSESITIPRTQATAPRPEKHQFSPEPHRSVGMTCLRFFSMRNSKWRATQTSQA